MTVLRTSVLLSFLAAGLNAAEQKPFMSFFNPPAQPLPLEEHRSYQSAAMKTKVGYNIYLPPGYADAGNTHRYPVIYWLHGRGCSESNDQFPASTVDAALRANTIPPLIFVYASGGGMSFYSDSFDGQWLAETTIIQELIPHMDATYRTVSNRTGRAIQGMSMGGFGALKLALKYPELFSSVVAFAGGYRSAEDIQANDVSREILQRVFGGDTQRFMANHPATIARSNAQAVRGRVAIKLLVGLDDPLLDNNRAMHAALTELNLAHEYWEIPGIKHDLPRLSAWLGADGLQFAVRHFAASNAKAEVAPARAAEAGKPVPAVASASKAPPGGSALPPGVKVLKDLEYGRASNRALRLDLYLPEQGQKPLPLIIWIHGGAWMAGSKDGPSPALRFTGSGYAVAQVGYRLSQEAVFPAQIHDCKAAVRWLRANARKYDLNPEKVIAWGASAGGHLVALLGTSGGVAELEGSVNDLKESSRVQAVVDWFGPTDFLHIGDAPSDIAHNASDSPESKLIGGPVLENKDKASKASPITYVSKDAPPFLIMHGDRDRTVPFSQSELLYEALKKAGVDAAFVPVKGAGHGFGGPEAMKPVQEFLERCFK